MATARGVRGSNLRLLGEAKLAVADARRLFPQLKINWLLTETPAPSIVIDCFRRLPEE
jgi:hypothetical protein